MNNPVPKRNIPALLQLFLLLLQALYLLLFFFDIGRFTNNLAFHFDKMMWFSVATSVLSFILYWIGFSRYSRSYRISFALLFLFHLGLASFSLYITIGTLVSRC